MSTSTGVYYVIEQGAVSPRDGTVGWRHWDATEDKNIAITTAKKLGLGRVLETCEIARFQDGHKVVMNDEEPTAKSRKK